MIPGLATTEGTRRFAARCESAAPGHFRTALRWTVSSLGLGTYAGEDDDFTDNQYVAALAQVLELGCNVIDTAVAYRHQRSERVIGRTLAKLFVAGKGQRDEVVISSKAGFLPFDSAYPGGPTQYIEEMYIKPGIITPADVVRPGHCLAPGFLRHQIKTSQNNLNCATIDIYYLHNPDIQLRQVDRREFRRRILAAFDVLEHAVADGQIAMYGVSSWSGFRVAPEAQDYLSLADLVRCATEIGGVDHHFRAVILTLNLAMMEGFAYFNQPVEGKNEPVSTIKLAADLGLIVMAGSSLYSGRLTRNLPTEVRAVLDGGLTTDAQYALQFTRSIPGLTTALVGMRNPAHVEENLALVKLAPISEDQLMALFC